MARFEHETLDRFGQTSEQSTIQAKSYFTDAEPGT